MLKALLLVRGAFNLLFGIMLLLWVRDGGLHGFSRGGFYALVDGLLALSMAAALLKRPQARWLALLALADAAVRLVFGALMLGNPEMQKMVVGEVVFLTGAVFACILLGLGGLVYVFVSHRLEAPSRREPAMAWPAATISACTLLLGVGLAFDFLDDQRRHTLAAYAMALGVTLGAAGYRLGRIRTAASVPAGS